METLRSKSIAISLAAAALVLVGLLYYLIAHKDRGPESVTLHTYVCDDESFYFMRMDEGAIEVAGARYELVSEEGGMRYEGAGPMAFTISGPTLNVSFKESGEAIASCEQGSLESAPILEVSDI